MREILPGVYHWVVRHPKIGFPVSSYWLADRGVVLDPMAPPGGLEFPGGSPSDVLLTNRHHHRDSARFAERFDATVWCAESGLHEFTAGEVVRPFRFGDPLPGDIEAIEIGILCPDETAYLVADHGGILAVGDSIVRHGDGPLGFVPDAYLGDDPERVKVALRAVFRRLAEREFDHLLLPHGEPWVGDARQALRAFGEG